MEYQMTRKTHCTHVDQPPTNRLAVNEFLDERHIKLFGEEAFHSYNTLIYTTQIGTSGNDTLRGGDDADELIGLDGDDKLYGNDGNDWLVGGLGADVMDGGAGDADAVDYRTSDIAVHVDLSDSRNNAGGALGDVIIDVEVVAGSNFDDGMLGDANSNLFSGGKGSDHFDGGAGIAGDYFDGGDDIDTVTYASAKAGVTVNLKDNSKNTGDAQGDGYYAVEVFEGSNFDDTMIAATGGTELHGLAGKDTLIGDVGQDQLLGGADDDRLIGGAGSDAIDGGSGFDTASYQDAATGIVLDLGTATNSTGDAKGDTFKDVEAYLGSSFDDKMRGAGAEDILDGGKGDDYLSGGAGNDSLYGDAGRDFLEGGDGNDALYGGADDDTLVGRLGDDTLFGGEGRDDVYGSEGNDILNGDGGDDILSGGNDADVLNGGSGKDTLYGGFGDDQLFGGDGNDQLYGSQDKDTLTGGSGADTFVLHLGDNVRRTLSGADLILDFEDGSDKFGLTGSLTFVDLKLEAKDVDMDGVSDVVISDRAGEYLVVVSRTTLGQITADDFISI
jgi:Ca2+-binding RTX toxin-like protein